MPAQPAVARAGTACRKNRGDPQHAGGEANRDDDGFLAQIYASGWRGRVAKAQKLAKAFARPLDKILKASAPVDVRCTFLPGSTSNWSESEQLAEQASGQKRDCARKACFSRFSRTKIPSNFADRAPLR